MKSEKAIIEGNVFSVTWQGVLSAIESMQELVMNIVRRQ